MQMKRIWLSAAATLLVLLAVVIAVAVFLAPGRAADIWTEIAKACIQLVVVVGLGGVVGVVLRSIDERRDERRARDERRFAIFQELVDAYHRIKSVRRQLRTVGLRAPGLERLRSEQLTALREGMTTIIEAELTLEQIYRELDARSVFDRNDDIREQLGRLLGYTSGLVGEWEKYGGAFWKDAQTRSVADLPKLQAFLGPAKADFTGRAADPIGWIEWIVRDELLSTPRARAAETEDDVPLAEFNAQDEQR
jgi:hypothetical protein